MREEDENEERDEGSRRREEIEDKEYEYDGLDI